MIDNYLKFSLFYLLWLVVHESAHIMSAFLFRLDIHGIGFRVRPIPHVYVEIDERNSPIKKFFFTASGVGVIFLLWMCFKISSYNLNFIASLTLTLQLITDTNPFHSDLQVLSKMFFRIKNNDIHSYFFSNIGILHFIVWGMEIIYMINYIMGILYNEV